jgi:hypothetical protein
VTDYKFDALMKTITLVALLAAISVWVVSC